MDITDTIIADAEELFPPKPGGMVDRHRQRKAAMAAAAQERKNEQEQIEERAYRAVKTAPESPEIISAITYTIAAGTYTQVLPSSPYRYRATVKLVTAASTVVLAKDSSAALGGAGYIMATGDQPLPVYARAQLYAYNNGGAPIQVSVLAEIYAPEQVDLPKPAPAPEHRHSHRED